jgi:N-glycosidase YbiA
VQPEPLRIYFYKANAAYGCFSNFSPHSILMPSSAADRSVNEYWATVEHYYQAHKFHGTKFDYLMAQIQAAPTPELAAQIGRNCKYQPHPDWDICKCEIMHRAIWQKFSTHADIQQVLLDTDDAEIIEDSPVDYFWGCGSDRTGTNHLGRILMQVRADLHSRDRGFDN